MQGDLLTVPAKVCTRFSKHVYCLHNHTSVQGASSKVLPVGGIESAQRRYMHLPRTMQAYNNRKRLEKQMCR